MRKIERVKQQNNLTEKLNARASKAEKKIVTEKAIRFSGGRVSDWIRRASIEYEPKE